MCHNMEPANPEKNPSTKNKDQAAAREARPGTPWLRSTVQHGVQGLSMGLPIAASSMLSIDQKLGVWALGQPLFWNPPQILHQLGIGKQTRLVSVLKTFGPFMGLRFG